MRNEYKVSVNSGGYKSWWLNGRRHREDGPAIEGFKDSKHWFLNGRRHREDGPAIICSDGTKLWYLNGGYLTVYEHRRAVRDK